MQVAIQIRTVFGEDKAYPMNATAKAVAGIAKTKTLTRDALAHVLAMGMTVVEMDRYGKECRTFRAADASNLPMVG